MSGGADPADLAARLLAWDGSAEVAEALRAEVRGLKDVRIRGTPPPGLRALAKAVELYRDHAAHPTKSRGPRSLAAWVVKDRNRDDARAIAPLVGDPEMGTWPTDDPFELPESELVAWCDALRILGPLVDARIRRFLRVAFLVRRRQTWPSACRAWAALALRDAGLREGLQAVWRACFPSLPATTAKAWKWPKTGLGGALAGSGALGGNGAHLVRHTLFLGACWRAVGGDPAVAGFEPEVLASVPLPADDADRSVVLAALTETMPVARDAVAPLLVDRVRELGSDELSEAAFRELYAQMPEGPARDAVRAGLLTPRWEPARADTLWEWLHTAAFFHERGDADAVAAMAAAAGEAARPLRWRIGDDLPDQPVESLVLRLGRLLDPDRLAIVPLRQRACLLAETRLLMGTADVRPLPWPSLVRAALGPSAPATLTGTVGDVGEPSLCVLLAERSLTSRTLMRDVVLEPANVLRIGHIQDGFVAGQVAVQAERILRDLERSSDRVRFLWNLLQQDPPYKTFAELSLVLRSELHLPGADGVPVEPAEEQPLRTMVHAVSALDQRRDEGADIRVIAVAFVNLVTATCQLLGDAEARTALDALAHDLGAAIDDPSDALDDPAWFARLEAVVLGADPRGGLVSWAWWLADGDPGTGTLERKRALTVKVLARLRAAAGMVRSARPAVTAEHHDELCAAAASLTEQIGPLGWPETMLIEGLLDRLRAGSAEALAEGRRSRAAIEAVNRLVERVDEAALADLVRDADRLRLLPVSELRRVHAELLGQLRFNDAEVLRRSVAERIRLPTRIAHLTPLFGAVAAGTFLVLDLGETWLALVDQRAWIRYGITVVLALGASYGLLLNDLRLAAGAGSARSARIALRALPTFLHAWAVSVAVSVLAMGTLGALAPTVEGALSLLLWSALALFLGVFIGLISQGQSATRHGGEL